MVYWTQVENVKHNHCKPPWEAIPHARGLQTKCTIVPAPCPMSQLVNKLVDCHLHIANSLIKAVVTISVSKCSLGVP